MGERTRLKRRVSLIAEGMQHVTSEHTPHAARESNESAESLRVVLNAQIGFEALKNPNHDGKD
jgi:hypothetical protein